MADSELGDKGESNSVQVAVAEDDKGKEVPQNKLVEQALVL